MKSLRNIALAGMMVATMSLSAANPVTSSYSVEAGTSHLADTYLTPLHYNGWHAALNYGRSQSMRGRLNKWLSVIDVRFDVDRDLNVPARNVAMWAGEVDLRWGMLRRFDGLVGVRALSVAVGGGMDLRGGVLYLSRNGNNPAAAKGAVTVDARAQVQYRMLVKRLPIVLSYQGDMPVTGAFFSPQYGQLYYEIWLGNHSGLAHPAWWGNYFDLDNLVTADLLLGGTTLRVGYHNHITSTKASSIVSRHITHAFVLGIVTEWTSVNRKSKALNDAATFQCIY